MIHSSTKGPSKIVNVSDCMLIAYKWVGGSVAKTRIADNFYKSVFLSFFWWKKPNYQCFICRYVRGFYKHLVLRIYSQVNRGPILNKKMKNRKYLSVFRQKRHFILYVVQKVVIYLHVNEYCIGPNLPKC